MVWLNASVSCELAVHGVVGCYSLSCRLTVHGVVECGLSCGLAVHGD